MKKYQLTVTTREGTGRSASRRLRKAEKIPAILYGKHTKPESLSVNAPEFVKLRKEIAGQAALIELKREAGPTALSFLQEIQRDAITDKYLHLDLHEVKLDEKFEIRVPVRIVGEAVGVKVGGGILETSSFQLRIRCLPKDLPNLIEVDVTAVEIGQTLHVSDMKKLPGVEFLDQANQPVVSCVEPPAEEVVETPAADAAAVPGAEGAAAAPGAEGAAAAPGAAGAAPAAGAKPGDAKAAAPAKGDAKGAAPAAGAKPAAPAKK